MSTTVRIPWNSEFNNEQKWNEVCAWAIEYFGLPGDRFQTRANTEYMDFIFNSNKDALLMSIRWNARIISDNELTVETVGRFIV